MRTTKADLQETVRRINLKLSHMKLPKLKSILLEYAYGSPRVWEADYGRGISPRLPAGKMALWLDGFESMLDRLD